MIFSMSNEKQRQKKKSWKDKKKCNMHKDHSTIWSKKQNHPKIQELKSKKTTIPFQSSNFNFLMLGKSNVKWHDPLTRIPIPSSYFTMHCVGSASDQNLWLTKIQTYSTYSTKVESCSSSCHVKINISNFQLMNEKKPNCC